MLSVTNQKRIKECPICGEKLDITVGSQKVSDVEYEAWVICNKCHTDGKLATAENRDHAIAQAIKNFNNLPKKSKAESVVTKKALKPIKQVDNLARFLNQKFNSRFVEDTSSKKREILSLDTTGDKTIFEDFEDVINALNMGCTIEQDVDGKHSLIVGNRNQFMHNHHTIGFLISAGFEIGKVYTRNKFNKNGLL